MPTHQSGTQMVHDQFNADGRWQPQIAATLIAGD